MSYQKKIEKSCIFQATIELLYQESASIETIVVKLSDALAADLLGSVDDSHKILKKRFFAICKESFIKDILKPVEVLLLERIL